MKTLIAVALIATVPFAATAATQPTDLAPAAVTVSVDQADLATFYAQDVKFKKFHGHRGFKKKAFKKGFYGKGFASKKYVGKGFIIGKGFGFY